MKCLQYHVKAENTIFNHQESYFLCQTEIGKYFFCVILLYKKGRIIFVIYVVITNNKLNSFKHLCKNRKWYFTEIITTINWTKQNFVCQISIFSYFIANVPIWSFISIKEITSRINLIINLIVFKFEFSKGMLYGIKKRFHV